MQTDMKTGSNTKQKSTNFKRPQQSPSPKPAPPHPHP
ncbi:hypothetical protein PSP6_440451 [Paraburkholderia tropica]|nr:hypothetical protein PSP6_440451 [Paraburkholderia tropica]